MKADTRTLQGIFHGDRCFHVPVYQRPYVWERERQWEPLWDDIEATAVRLAEARVSGHAKGVEASAADQAAAPHFLGAIVIEDQPVMTGAVDTRLVVDGQQRLTTLQLLLRGVLDALDDADVARPLRARIRKATRNDDEVVGADELLKLTPRQAERETFTAAMAAERPEPSASSFAEARGFFEGAAAEFLAADDVPADPYSPGHDVEARASLLVATLLGLVKLVVIDLEGVDDAQVIFEALNARNTPLSATDLVKNLLFMRAQAQHHDPQAIYDQLWRRFDDDSDWWRGQVGVGHAQRARQDWLLGDWLIAQLGKAINVGRLYGEFRGWLEDSKTKPLDALSTLKQYADAYEALNDRRAGATERELEAFRRIERLNITVATPVMLWLLVQSDDQVSRSDRERAVLAVESFVVRRMAIKAQTRAYNQVFVDVLRAARAAPADPAQAVIDSLRGAPHGYAWPTLEELESGFMTGRYYGPGGINQERLRMVLSAIDRRLQSEAPKSESSVVNYDSLQIEHVMPRSWRDHWPVTIADPAERLLAEQEREAHVNRIGNLTLATKHLNPAMSNAAWPVKRSELREHSKLHLSARLVEEPDWDEARVTARGQWLAQQLERIWPGPHDPVWGVEPSPKAILGQFPN